MFIYGTYALEEEVDSKFSLSDIWNLFQEDDLPSNSFYRQMIKCYKAWNYLQKTSDLPLNTNIIRQTISWWGNIESHLHLQVTIFFAPTGHIERYMEDSIFRFHETKKDDPIMAAANLFGNIVNIHPFEDGNRRICRLILAHVLIQMKCFYFQLSEAPFIDVAEDIT